MKEPKLVDLIQALSLPPWTEDLALLSRGDWLIVRQRTGRPALSKTRRFGSVKDVVVHVLREAGEVQSYNQIYAAVEQALEGSVARSSVKNALTRGCSSRQPAFERVEYGRYRLLPKIR